LVVEEEEEEEEDTSCFGSNNILIITTPTPTAAVVTLLARLILPLPPPFKFQVKMEEDWEAGEGRLLPDFKTYKELYQNKIIQQEGLSKQLRKQQKSLKENEFSHSEQRKYFVDLRALLALKMKVVQSVANKQGGMTFGDALGKEGREGGGGIWSL